MANAQATHQIIAPNIRVAVQQSVVPHTDHLHKRGGPTDADMLAEIRKVLVDLETYPCGPLDSDLQFIAAAAMVALERRAVARRNAA